LNGSENKCFSYFHKEGKTWILHPENTASFFKYLKAKRSQINSQSYTSTWDMQTISLVPTYTPFMGSRLQADWV